MKNRYEEIQKIAEHLSAGDFEAIATDDTMKKEAQDPSMMGAAPPMDPTMMGAATMVPPDMMPPAGGEGAGSAPSSEAVAAQGLTEVALRQLDLTQGVIEEALGSGNLSPADQVDATAAALETSGALNGIPPEELEALAQQPAPPIA